MRKYMLFFCPYYSIHYLSPCRIILLIIVLKVPLIAQPLIVILNKSFTILIGKNKWLWVSESCTCYCALPKNLPSSLYFSSDRMIIIVYFDPVLQINSVAWIYLYESMIYIEITLVILMETKLNWNACYIIIARPILRYKVFLCGCTTFSVSSLKITDLVLAEVIVLSFLTKFIVFFRNILVNRIEVGPFVDPVDIEVFNLFEIGLYMLHLILDKIWWIHLIILLLLRSRVTVFLRVCKL